MRSKYFLIVGKTYYKGVVPGLVCGWSYQYRKPDRSLGHTSEFYYCGDAMETAKHFHLFERFADSDHTLTGGAMFTGYFEEKDVPECGPVLAYLGPKAVRKKMLMNAKNNEKIAAFCKEHGFTGEEEYIDWRKVAELK
jgi:hypothetical protein